MKVLKFSFLGVVGAFVVGIYAGSQLGILLAALLLLAFFFVLLVSHFVKVSLYYRYPSISFVYYFLVMLVFFGLGSFVVNLHQAVQDRDHYRFTRIDASKHKIQLVLDEALKTTTSGKRFYAHIQSVDSEFTRGSILVVVRDSLLEPRVGQEWLVFQELRKLQAPSSYGQFDYSSYLNAKDVYAQVYLEGTSAYFIADQEGFKHRLRSFRERWLHRVKASVKEPDIANLAGALLFGARTNLETQLVDDFKRTGVVHVLAISGLHVGILFLLLHFVFQRFPIFIKTLGILSSLWFFVFLSGFSPSVFRAVFMCSIVVLAALFRRKQLVYNTVAFAMLVSLCIRPKWIYDIGFQLSYAAVFSIVFFYPILQPFLKSRWKMVRYLKELMAISIAAQLGVLPLLIYYFHQFPLFFLLGNLIAIPLITLLLFLGFALLFTSVIWFDLSVIIGFLFSFFSDLLIAGIKQLNSLQLFVVEEIPFHFTLVFSMTILMYLFGYFLKVKKPDAFNLLLLSLAVFQVNLIVLRTCYAHQAFLVIPNDRANLFLLHKTNGNTVVYRYEADSINSGKLLDFKRATWSKEIATQKGPLFFDWSGKRFFIVNSEAAVLYRGRCDVVVFSGAVSLNFNRVLAQVQPAEVVIHNSVPFWNRKLIMAFCVKEKIPFHDCYEKGFYKI